MGKLLSLFWEVDPPRRPLSFTVPHQDYQCQQDGSCGTVGTFLIGYFVIILVLMVFSRAPIWVSEKKKDEDSGTSAAVSKASRDASYEWQNKDGAWDCLQMMKKPKQSPRTPVTVSELAWLKAYLEQRRSGHHSPVSQVNQTQLDSETTEWDSDESDLAASSWKESESEHSSSAGTRAQVIQRQKNGGAQQTRKRLCLHCKAMRTHEWWMRHFLQDTSVTAPVKGDIQEENTVPDTKTRFSKF